MFTSNEQILPPSLVSKILPLVKLVFRSARTFVTAVAFSVRDLKIRRRRRQRERPKSNKLNRQNNNNARASRFFVHFFAVTARLRRENAYNFTSFGGRKQTTVKFSLSFWTWIGFLGIGSKTVHLLLTKYMSWSNRDRDWKNANSLFKRRFRGRRHRGISNSLFLNPSNVTFRSPKKLFWGKAKKVVSKRKKEGKLSKAKKTHDWCFHWSRGRCNQLVLRLTMTWLIFVTDGTKDHVAIFLTT